MSSLGSLGAAASAVGVNLPGLTGDSSDANFIDIVQSRTICEKLLNTKFSFSQRTWAFGPKLQRSCTLDAYLGKKNVDRSIERLLEIMSVKRDAKSKILTIAVETRSPELSQEIIQKATAFLEEFVEEKGRTRGGAKAIFAEARLAEARKDMLKAKDDYRQFLDGNRNYQTSGDPTIRLNGLQLEAELKLRQQLVLNLALSYEQALMDEKNDVPILNVMDPGNLPIDKSWPPRSLVMIITFVLGVLVEWAWLNQGWIVPRLLGMEGLTETGVKQ
jgi:uncharacterized protein involved in exopolysaccharide biosynthesis